ncbi:transporter substrate-binding domain-containing protein [Chthonobacter rhizosphaerae]|uniref:transporter substrate-binding domain-containing protein n=1 Tax=Chthonobacter rhizosphaerae TaxID=2735553 RepID=UPI0015EFBCC2|nr:transporter substrate-binding domain-containing protein [Chthonobacter rhizosphaerae]
MSSQSALVRRFGALLSSLALAGTLIAGTAVSARAEKLKLGNEGVYPPFSMVDSAGNLTGVEPDLAREMCARMKVECEIVVMDFKALVPSMLQGKFDILISQLTPTAERKEKMLFTQRVVANPMTFVVPKDFNADLTKEALKGKGVKIGMQRGGAHIKYIENWLGDSLEYSFYDNPDQTRMDLLAGRINMLFEAKINVTLELINKPEGKDYKLYGGEYWIGEQSVPEAERGLSWAVAKGREELRDRIDATLAAMIADCTYTKIRKKYLDITTLPADAECEAKTN